MRSHGQGILPQMTGFQLQYLTKMINLFKISLLCLTMCSYSCSQSISQEHNAHSVINQKSICVHTLAPNSAALDYRVLFNDSLISLGFTQDKIADSFDCGAVNFEENDKNTIRFISKALLLDSIFILTKEPIAYYFDFNHRTEDLLNGKIDGPINLQMTPIYSNH